MFKSKIELCVKRFSGLIFIRHARGLKVERSFKLYEILVTIMDLMKYLVHVFILYISVIFGTESLISSKALDFTLASCLTI